jgi:hypothetical protein
MYESPNLTSLEHVVHIMSLQHHEPAQHQAGESDEVESGQFGRHRVALWVAAKLAINAVQRSKNAGLAA